MLLARSPIMGFFLEAKYRSRKSFIGATISKLDIAKVKRMSRILDERGHQTVSVVCVAEICSCPLARKLSISGFQGKGIMSMLFGADAGRF